MASEDAPVFKKLKVEDKNEDIFTYFHKYHLQTLEDVLVLLNNRLSGYGVGVLKIKVCNALSSKRFSSAACDCEQLRKFGDGCSCELEGFKIRGIFQYGFKILEAYVQSPERTPQRKGARIALTKLLKFLLDIEYAEQTLSSPDRKDIGETEWTALVAQHLLSKLAVGSNYMLDNLNKGQNKDLYCPCGCDERLLGDYGDTSMGVPSYWHGRVDILMDVAVTIATEEPDSTGAGNNSSMEITSDRLIACKEQISAETIVSSFLKKKKHPDLDNYLIPTIAMSKTQVAVCLYDCENDIFLETPLLDLFRGEFLKMETIITLWLVLNYKYCCSGVPEEIIELNYKADFFKHVGPDLEKYIYNVRAPCPYQSEDDWLSIRVLRDVSEVVDDINNISQPP